jgi:transposase
VAVREALVQTRTRHISLIRALLRQQGYRIRSGGAATFSERVDELELPEAFKAQMAPLLGVMGSVNAQLTALEQQAKTHEVAKRLCTAAGVGPVTAISFVATVDRVERFDNAKQVRAYLGLVPRELSSGEKQHRGHITKAGNRRMRALLVEAPWQLRRCACLAGARSGWPMREALRCRRVGFGAVATTPPPEARAYVDCPLW